MGWLASLRNRARLLKAETLALALAATDRRTPWLARLLVVVAVAYALSPIDLIPDFIPVLGWLDDLVLLPLLITLAVKLTPPEVLADARVRAGSAVARGKRLGWWAAAVILGVWAVILVLVAGWIAHLLGH
ncbi:MAG: hypothetical protein RL669_1161 [Pseudomonadota bacterium]|jgi:uncharacterized membrane protein YkvA (DUF1232 family)